MGLRVIILAAGKGTRMKSPLPKVLYQLAGKPMVRWIVDSVAELDPAEVLVVVGHEADAVIATLPEGVTVVEQAEQLGTGHAVQLALDATDCDPSDIVLVLPGDAPLITVDTLAALLEEHAGSGAAATLLTTDFLDPSGYGRVLRDPSGATVGIVEDPDASDEQRSITEVSTSIYAFAAQKLEAALSRVTADNTQGEYYLPDVIGLLAGEGEPLRATKADIEEVAGINSLDQLAEASARARRHINAGWMAEGVWMLDPERVYIEAGVELAAGVRLYPGVHLEGDTTVAAGAEIGPDSHVRDCRIGEDAVVRYSVIESAEVGARATVGPYARLRGGATLGAESKAGTFVEMKKTTLGARSKVPHLSYVGDAEIGEDTNIGAGSITCNFDGSDKHLTKIGDRAFIGSDTMLVAPVEIGDDAWTGAGSTITKDVNAGSLAVERGQQRELPDYSSRRRRRAEARDAEEQSDS